MTTFCAICHVLELWCRFGVGNKRILDGVNCPGEVNRSLPQHASNRGGIASPFRQERECHLRLLNSVRILDSPSKLTCLFAGSCLCRSWSERPKAWPFRFHLYIELV